MNFDDAIIRVNLDDEGELRLVLIAGESYDICMNELLSEVVAANPKRARDYAEAMWRLYDRTARACGGS